MIPDKAVEAAAAGMWERRPMQRTTDGAPLPFSEADTYQRVRYLSQAFAALEAALPFLSDAARQPQRNSPTVWPDIPKASAAIKEAEDHQ